MLIDFLNYKVAPRIPSEMIWSPRQGLYKMIDVKNSRTLGCMEAYPVACNGRDTLFIDGLEVYKKRCGYGTKFLNIAKKLSKENNCGGRLALVADRTPLDPMKPPHIFYRKYGFGTDNSSMLEFLDRCIKRGTSVPPYIAALEMYYPYEKKNTISLWQQIKNFFKKKTL